MKCSVYAFAGSVIQKITSINICDIYIYVYQDKTRVTVMFITISFNKFYTHA